MYLAFIIIVKGGNKNENIMFCVDHQACNFIIVCMVFCQVPNAVSREPQKNRCRFRSECVKLSDCAYYVNFTHNFPENPNLNAAFFKFLKSRLCGFVDDNPKVCCTKLPAQLQKITSSLSDRRPHCKAPLECMKLTDCHMPPPRPPTDDNDDDDNARKENQSFITLQRCDFDDDDDNSGDFVCCSSLNERWKNNTAAAAASVVGFRDMVNTSERPKTPPPTSTAKPLTLADKAEAINRFYLMDDFLEFMAFDLINRRKRGSSHPGSPSNDDDDDGLEIEIR